MTGEPVVWAVTQAMRLEPIEPSRFAHTKGVATTVQRLSVVLPEQADRDMLIAAACVHDIGYIPELAHTGFHPLDGAQYIADHGHHRLAGLVAHHTGARHEAALRGLGGDLAAFPRETGPVAALLTHCDLTTGPHGQSMTPRERVIDIARRYGAQSPVTQGVTAAWPELLDQLATVTRLRGQWAMTRERRDTGDNCRCPACRHRRGVTAPTTEELYGSTTRRRRR